ncbi:MAG: transposase [Sphingomonadaceae bacterium]
MISSGSTLAEDIRYALSHWQGQTRFSKTGASSSTRTLSRNAIRPVCPTRKNALFAEHEVWVGNWPCLRQSLPPASSTTSTRPPKSPKHSAITAILIAESKT